MIRLLSLAALLFALPAQAVTIDSVTVGAPGNACDTQDDGCFGAVPYTYEIGKYEVTNAQYAEFLNAKAASDPLDLYNTNMNPNTGDPRGGIERTGSSGSFTYSATAGRENKPVVFVSLYDTFRFANWLNNGQGSGDTETGAYTLLGGTPIPSNGQSVTRNASATIFLTSEDEWYKAAYYDAISASYNPYPFADGFNGGACEVPAGTTTHSANCDRAVGNSTDVGAYTTSPSVSGTFDQGGNVREWNEDIHSGPTHVVRGGIWSLGPAFLAASLRSSILPALETSTAGFRVAMIPEPGTGLLLMSGLLALAGYRQSRR